MVMIKEMVNWDKPKKLVCVIEIKVEKEISKILSIDVDNSASSKVVGAKLDETFEDYFEVMIQKHKTNKVPIQNGEDIIILNSFDGAEALRPKDNINTLISFSSSLFTPRLTQ